MNKYGKKEIILASGSPRRKELMARICDDFRVIPSEVEEGTDDMLTPEENAVRLAELKCDDVFADHPDSLVVGCDTLVALGYSILGKPRDKDIARRYLRVLSGKRHKVITGVCVRSPKGMVSDCEITEVCIREMTDEEINRYIEDYSPMDKAGAYGIQDGQVVKEYYGSYTNVVGLPVALVKKLVEELL